MIRKTLVAASILICKYGFAQISADTIQKRLLRYNQNLPQEKIYLHLDRPHYAPGDTVWFKVYITDASSHELDSVSKNIYVDLYRKDTGKKIRKSMVKNLGGFSYGNISLQDTLSEGVYEIRAFTNWMRNFPENQFFHKEVYVRRKFAVRNVEEPDKLSLLEVADLQFFPEGGNLVAGMQSRVAFKGVNKFGKGVDFAAYIVSDRGDTVTTIQSKHLGMGSFIFTPNAGQRYFAKIAKENRSEGQLQKLYHLPEPLAKGYTFFVDNLSNKEMIKVMVRSNLEQKDQPILVGHCRGIPVFSLQSAAEGNSFSWSLPKTDIPYDGVVQLTLFDREGTPHCERLIYNDTKTPLSVMMHPDKTEYASHEKVTLSLEVKDSEGKPVRGNFSVAVTDNQQVNTENNAEDIHSYFYLSSDVQPLSAGGVKGTIEQPAYYFNRENTDAPVHLDILLMTQGWRRFTWNDVLTQTPKKETFDVETGINVSGKAKLATGKKLTKPLNVSMIYSSEPGAKSFDVAKTDLDGNFTFKNILIKEPIVAMMQGSKDNGNRFVTISVDEYKWPDCSTAEGLDPFFFDVEQVKAYQALQKHYAELEEQIKNSRPIVLKGVTVTARREKESDSRKTLYEGTNMQTVVVSEQACGTAMHVLQMLQGRVAGLEITGFGTQFRAIVRGHTSMTGSNAPVYLLDGMIIGASFLNSISPCSVESIDVVTHPVVTYNAKGLVSILTKRANPNYDWSKDVPQGTVYPRINGYDIPREFYSPKYDAGPKNIPDFRATLYWNPIIKTDSEGKAKVTFWNSDEKTSVHISVEGISTEGVPVAGRHEYMVK